MSTLFLLATVRVEVEVSYTLLSVSQVFDVLVYINDKMLLFANNEEDLNVVERTMDWESMTWSPVLATEWPWASHFFLPHCGHRVTPLPVCSGQSWFVPVVWAQFLVISPFTFRNVPIWMIPYIVTIAMTPKDFSLSHQQNKGC